MSYLSHDIFLRSVNISGIIKATSRIHIGTSRDIGIFEEADSLLIRINHNGIDLPYIPGSSLKGIFRSTVEFLLDSIGEKVCKPYDKNSKCSNVGKEILNANKERDDKKLIEAIRRLCLACKIFGGHNYASQIFISDSVPLDISSVAFDISPGISINRRDGTTIQGGLFTLEHINPNSKFNFQLRVNNLPNYLLGILFKVIYLINKGIVLVGGKKRAGLGYISIIIDKIIYKTSDKTYLLDYDDLDNLTIKDFKLEQLNESNIKDYEINIPLSDLKEKSREEFSDILIEYFMEAWDKFVRDKY